ncbi:hypothetical protein EVAR_41858_1 [Eumeta japonica]|uniref:Uncharacterized protein n=1 Tax=Eumeta variegata TaxID=151549 RepID=A0A4C1X8N0_EUMVA|nr:hypothetical protein EVAR_41858_1 [Eumeta japonica]
MYVRNNNNRYAEEKAACKCSQSHPRDAVSGVAVALCLDPMSLKQFVNRQNAYVGILCTNDDANIPGVFRHTSSASTLHAQAPAPRTVADRPNATTWLVVWSKDQKE